MALAGNIKEFGLADIFQIVSLQQKTGVLTVESSEGKVSILLENGFIVGADATFRPIEERVTQILTRSEKLDKFKFKRVTEMQKKTLQPIWTLLAETGELDLQELRTIVSQQIHETIYSVLRWTSGEYRFDPKKSVEYDKNVIEPINTEFLVMEGFRITDEWSEIEKTITSFQLVIRQAPEPSVPVEQLSEAEQKVYKLLTTEKTVQDIIDMSQLGEFDSCQTIYELMRKKMVTRVQEKGEKAPKTRKISINIQDIFRKVATVVIGIAFLVGAIWSFRYIPENFILLHKPSFKVFAQMKQLASQAQLNNLSQIISAFYLERQKFPGSLEELLGEKLITSKNSITDPWGNPYTLNTTKAQIIIRGAGADGKFETDDDINLAIPR